MAGGLLLTSSVACGASTDAKASADTNAKDSTARVEIFVPSDGITLTQNTPTNKWGGFADAIKRYLVESGYSQDSITVVTSGSLTDQAKALADYVEKNTASDDDATDSADADAGTDTEANAADATASTDSTNAETETSTPKPATSQDKNVVILAPALKLDAAAKQFGDLIGDGTKELGSSATISAVLSTQEAAEQQEAETSIARSTQTIRAWGSALITVARNLEDVSSDMFVKTSSAYQIGMLQANELAVKLELSQATTANPKRIEIVIPEESNETISSDFFDGVWSVLGPYFKKGTAISASGLVASTSTEADWRDVLIPADSEAQVRQAFSDLLTDAQGEESGAVSSVRLDGVVASNDFIATQVTDVLKERGYTGSAADINPEITLSGIVGNIAGNQDLSREKVPSPTSDVDTPPVTSPDDAADSGTSTSSSDTDSSRWPIVTGYGSYVNNIPLVVSGKQWLTGLENRNGLASDIADACTRYSTGEKIQGSSSKTITLNGKKVPLITRSLVGIVGTNIKSSLIDTGYVTAAEAGL